MIDKSNPMDLVFMLALIHTVPLKALLWANFGASASDVRYKTRMTLIIGGLVAIWVSYAAVWHYNGFSPLEIWRATPDWWTSDYGPFGYAVAIISFWAAISPLHAAYDIFWVERARRAKKRLDRRRVHSAARDLISNTPPS